MPKECPHRALGSHRVALHSLSGADDSSIQVLCPWCPLLLSNDAPGCNSAVKGLPGFRTARLSRNQDQGGTRMRGYGQTPRISASPVAALLPGDSRRFSDGWGNPNSVAAIVVQWAQNPFVVGLVPTGIAMPSV